MIPKQINELKSIQESLKLIDIELEKYQAHREFVEFMKQEYLASLQPIKTEDGEEVVIRK